ncbi:MAG: hypothetical protein KBD24_04255 [Candidatus Pacebacteria bacterium]|nr:hypothetical protein [Candidatus Paceibacterota bacterium]
MVHMNQPFFSIVSAAIFSILGLFFGSMGVLGDMVTFGYLEVTSQAVWGITGLMFIMAYFSLVHLRIGKK